VVDASAAFDPTHRIKEAKKIAFYSKFEGEEMNNKLSIFQMVRKACYKCINLLVRDRAQAALQDVWVGHQ